MRVLLIVLAVAVVVAVPAVHASVCCYTNEEDSTVTASLCKGKGEAFCPKFIGFTFEAEKDGGCYCENGPNVGPSQGGRRLRQLSASPETALQCCLYEKAFADDDTKNLRDFNASSTDETFCPSDNIDYDTETHWGIDDSDQCCFGSNPSWSPCD